MGIALIIENIVESQLRLCLRVLRGGEGKAWEGKGREKGGKTFPLFGS